MPRRGISEVVATLLLMAVVAAASLLAVNTSSKQIAESEKTVEEALSKKSMQVQELVSIISSKVASNKVTIEMINYGLKDVELADVLVDGSKTDFILKNGNVVISSNIISKKKILVLETNMTGNSVQMITDTGNLININLQ